MSPRSTLYFPRRSNSIWASSTPYATHMSKQEAYLSYYSLCFAASPFSRITARLEQLINLSSLEAAQIENENV